MKVSEPMQRLRDALSARRIPWEDKSDYMDRGDAGIHVNRAYTVPEWH